MKARSPRAVPPALSLVLVLLAPLSGGVCGCGPSPAAEAARSRGGANATAAIPVPPKQLVQDLRQVLTSQPLSLGVESEERGTLVTGWKRYRGDWHIGRHWQERTRYRVEVVPDWDEPTGRSGLRVTAETEQRAAEGQRWDREPRVPRPERARDVLQRILQQLPQAANATAPSAG
jgi:hypothetical protein